MAVGLVLPVLLYLCLQAEAEIFYCFSEVMQQQRDAFCKALDPTDAGVRGRLSSLDGLLRQKVRR